MIKDNESIEIDLNSTDFDLFELLYESVEYFSKSLSNSIKKINNFNMILSSGDFKINEDDWSIIRLDVNWIIF